MYNLLDKHPLCFLQCSVSTVPAPSLSDKQGVPAPSRCWASIHTTHTCNSWGFAWQWELWAQNLVDSSGLLCMFYVISTEIINEDE